MSNGFLSNYGKNDGGSDLPASEITVRDADLSYKYEEKSSFKKPQLNDGGGLPPVRRVPRLLVPIIVGSVLVVALIITLLLILGGGVRVIDLTDKTLTDAQLWASQNGVMLTLDKQYNDEHDENTVFGQSIQAGGEVKKGEFLTLTVSLGHDLSVMLPLPDLMSMTIDEVQAWAKENYMTKVRITSEYSETVPSGKVIRYEITDNTVVDQIRRDTPVYVIVSKGAEDVTAIQVTIPDFKTMTVSEAYIFANENGVVLKVTEQYDDYVPKNSVISQSVKAEEKVSRGSEIELILSKGKMITVPDFSDYSKDEAVSVAGGLGIPVTVTEKYSSSSTGRFLSQSLEAGAEYDGEYLELVYSLGNKISVSSFVGSTRDAVESWAYGLNQQGAKITIKVTETKSSSPKGVIVYQDPVNTLVGVKTTINVTVSLGKLVYMPDFVDDSTDLNRGYGTAITREDAMTMCEQAGLVPVFVAESQAGRLPGEVWYQSVAAGTETSDGTTVTLKYVPSATFVVPSDLIGKAKADATAAYGKNLRLIFIEGDTYIGDGSDVVTELSLPAGTTVASGTEITLTLGQP